MNQITRLKEWLSDRIHARDDAFAGQVGWTTTKTTGRFGFGARVYRDPRFGQRQAAASKTTHPAGAPR